MFRSEAITLHESGGVSSKQVPGRFDTRADAFAAAIDYAQLLTGPVRDDLRIWDDERN